MRRARCKICGSCDVAWHLSVAGHWQMFDTTPVVFVPDAGGLALTRDGWVQADSARTEPPEMLPRHRCHRPDTRRDPAPMGDMLVAARIVRPAKHLRVVR